jgi:hypothetical protein
MKAEVYREPMGPGFHARLSEQHGVWDRGLTPELAISALRKTARIFGAEIDEIVTIGSMDCPMDSKLRRPMDQHICTICGHPVEDHPSKCTCGCEQTFFVPTCCPGCDCLSFEEAHSPPWPSEYEMANS